MDGSKVWPAWLDGEIVAIRAYCETDVLNTYLLYLRFQLIRGQLTADAYDLECEFVRGALAVKIQEIASRIRTRKAPEIYQANSRAPRPRRIALDENVNPGRPERREVERRISRTDYFESVGDVGAPASD